MVAIIVGAFFVLQGAIFMLALFTVISKIQGRHK